MGLTEIAKQCIVKADGSMVCWDRATKSFYRLQKELLKKDEISQEDLLELFFKVEEQK